MNKTTIENIKIKVEEVLNENNIIVPPVDLNKVVEKANINLKYNDLEDDISGVIDLRDLDRVKILINQNHSKGRQRFSISHELGHFYLHKNSSIHVDKKQLFRDRNSSEGTLIKEIEANRFAAELLMPEKMIRDIIEKSGKKIDIQDDNFLQELADKFQVSTMAMAIRIDTIYKKEISIAF